MYTCTCQQCKQSISQKYYYTKDINKKLPCQNNKGKIKEVLENIEKIEEVIENIEKIHEEFINISHHTNSTFKK